MPSFWTNCGLGIEALLGLGQSEKFLRHFELRTSRTSLRASLSGTWEMRIVVLLPALWKKSVQEMRGRSQDEERGRDTGLRACLELSLEPIHFSFASTCLTWVSVTCNPEKF